MYLKQSYGDVCVCVCVCVCVSKASMVSQW